MALRTFGLVVVSTAGTPVRATVNVPASQGGPTDRRPLQSVLLQAHPENTGKVYVFLGGSQFTGDHRTSLDVSLGILPAPADGTTGAFGSISYGIPNASAGINLADLWIDVESSGDGVIITGTEQ